MEEIEMEKKTTAKAAAKTTTKAAATEVKETVKTVEEVKAEPAKTEAPVEEKVETKKAPAKKAATKTAAKKETATEEKAEAKKAPAKKTTAKKEVKANVVLQFAGQEANMDVIVANAKNAFVAEGNKESDIKEIQVYVKPEEYAAYYVINQEFSGRVNLF